MMLHSYDMAHGTSAWPPYLWLDGAVNIIAAQVVDQQLHDLITVGQDVLLNVAAQITQHTHSR